MVKNYWSKKTKQKYRREDNTGYNGLYNSLSDRKDDAKSNCSLLYQYCIKNAYVSALENYLKYFAME